MGEAVPHVAELALLDVLLDGVEGLLLGDLREMPSALRTRRGICSIERRGLADGNGEDRGCMVNCGDNEPPS